ncbi:MAG TPA: efflux RND transporter periplasmic adaptor subunit [Rhodothermales bacterium]|nr:efflux RND transporter periplasmic adaptor subunit [Rhodothermales bacterium]
MISSKSSRRPYTWLIAALVIGGTLGGYLLGRSGKDDSEKNADSAGAMATSTSMSMQEDGEREILYWRAPMDPNERYDAPGKSRMGMDLVPVYPDDGQGAPGTISIDPTIVQNVGVRTARVEVMSLRRTIRTTGRFEMDEQGAHTVSLKIDGWVEKLYVDYEGSIVQEGEPLFDLYSPQLVSTQDEYLLALNSLKAAKSQALREENERLLEAARRRLLNWDLRPSQIEALEGRGTPARTMTFYAPASGEVMNKSVVEGQRAMAGEPLMDIMDISRIWLMADIYEQDLPWIFNGAAARIELPYRPGRPLEGRIDHIYYMMESETRTARARIILPRLDASVLKPGMFATVYLSGRELERTPVVPDEAIIRTGERATVIRSLGEGRFLPVEVKTGAQADDLVQILDGLEGGEHIVVRAQFLIDSEARLKSAVEALTTPGASDGQRDIHQSMDHRGHGAVPEPAMNHDTQPMEDSTAPAGNAQPQR